MSAASAITAPRPGQRPLLVRCGAFGDMVLITALIRELHARWRQPVDVLTSGPWSAPLLAGQPGVGEVCCVRSRKTPYWLSLDQRRAVRWLRARGPGPVWFCDANPAARPMLSRGGIADSHIVDVADHPLLPAEHATSQWWRLAQFDPPAAAAPSGPGDRRAQLAPAAVGCQLQVDPRQRAQLAAWLDARGLSAAPLMLVQVGNKRTMRRGLKRLAVNHKYWPNERWAAVLAAMRARCPHHALLMLGTGPEYELNREVAALARIDGLYNVADDLPIPRLLALLERAAGLITVDSGPAHAAAAVGCPMVVLFGRASTSLYRPRGVDGADVRVLSAELNGRPDMLGIEVESVVAAWSQLRLRQTGGPGAA